MRREREEAYDRQYVEADHAMEEDYHRHAVEEDAG